MLEGFSALESALTLLMNATAAGFLVQAHAGYAVDGSDQHCANITNSLAAFLVAAGEYSYYHCSLLWQSDPSWPSAGHDADEWLVWRPEYDRPLGPPLGNAVKKGSVYSRNFSLGTYVEFDTSTNTGKIMWGDGHVQQGTP
jgi:hypothetical protein